MTCNSRSLKVGLVFLASSFNLCAMRRSNHDSGEARRRAREVLAARQAARAGAHDLDQTLVAEHVVRCLEVLSPQDEALEQTVQRVREQHAHVRQNFPMEPSQAGVVFLAGSLDQFFATLAPELDTLRAPGDLPLRTAVFHALARELLTSIIRPA